MFSPFQLADLVSSAISSSSFSRMGTILARTITLLVFTAQEWEDRARQDEAFYESIIADGLVIQGNLPLIKK
jgi:hypothetical protein